MPGQDENALTDGELREAGGNYRRRLVLCSGLFLVFFVFYIASAVIQTPAFSGIAGMTVLGMPFGLLMSLLIFPVSWAIIVVFFVRWR